ncbi:MAG: hypothetical protein ACXVBW_12735 [Bdellovibrionota bacterium]
MGFRFRGNIGLAVVLIAVVVQSQSAAADESRCKNPGHCPAGHTRKHDAGGDYDVFSLQLTQNKLADFINKIRGNTGSLGSSARAMFLTYLDRKQRSLHSLISDDDLKGAGDLIAERNEIAGKLVDARKFDAATRNVNINPSANGGN